VNPTFLSFDDWWRKASTKDSVIAKIDAQPKIFIVGSQADLDKWANKNLKTSQTSAT
jgi:hypothetical protein